MTIFRIPAPANYRWSIRFPLESRRKPVSKRARRMERLIAELKLECRLRKKARSGNLVVDHSRPVRATKPLKPVPAWRKISVFVAGGNANLPVQSDKSANLPNER